MQCTPPEGCGSKRWQGPVVTAKRTIGQSVIHALEREDAGPPVGRAVLSRLCCFRSGTADAHLQLAGRDRGEPLQPHLDLRAGKRHRGHAPRPACRGQPPPPRWHGRRAPPKPAVRST
jgi:hypothetical protein